VSGAAARARLVYLNDGLNAGLSISEIKETLVQMYAYSGFPRSLNGLNTLLAVLEARKACIALARLPSRRQRRKQPYTVCQGGKSFGKNRHWQPVFITYRIPLTVARKSCLGCRPADD
jgi:hypothetical protein